MTFILYLAVSNLSVLTSCKFLHYIRHTEKVGKWVELNAAQQGILLLRVTHIYAYCFNSIWEHTEDSPLYSKEVERMTWK